MRRFYPLVLVLLCLISGSLSAQTTITGKVKNDKTRQPVDYATILIQDQGLWAVTNENGEFVIQAVRPGKIVLSISCLGFEKKSFEFSGVAAISQDNVFYIKEDNLALKEVVVTAEKKKNEIATSYVIDRNAINHMQTTSIEDVLSQLPGGQTLQANTLAQSKSAMADAQRLALRSQNSTELDNPSFGTAIEIDGVRLSNNSNYTDGAAGVDTRNIGIHNIESIEVTTGLPSVEHGDLSSGLISINTKKGRTPLEIEIVNKPLMTSYSASKGFGLGKRGGTLNASFEHTRSISDRTSPYTTYMRNSVNLEYQRTFGSKQKPLIFTYVFSGNAGGFDSKADPDAYQNTYEKMKDNALRNGLKANWLLRSPWLTSLEFAATMNYTDKKLEAKTLQSSSSAQPALHTMEEGYFMSAPYSVNPSANILLLPVGTWYQVSYNDEKPVNYSLEMKAKWSRNFGQVRSNLLLGSQYNTSGNYGKGVSYADMRYAPTYREFRYDKQPFVNNMAFYAEEKAVIPVQKKDLQLQAGVRSDMTWVNGSEYGTVSGFSPRINVQYAVIDHSSRFVKQLNVHVGWGDAVKLPSSAMLFPTPTYTDRIAFASTSTNGIASYAYYTTPQKAIYNEDLKWQRNRKSEIGIDMDIRIARISVTGYMEKTFNPYILSSVYTPFTYNLTDQSALSNCPISAANSIYTIDQKSGIVTVTDKTGQYASQTLSNTTYNTFNNNKYYTNGTPVIKRGVEWVIDFKEISALKTSVKLDGAYSYYKGEEETIIPSLRSSGKMSDGNYYKYIGYYVGGDNISNGSTTKRLTTNVTLTTHIPVLRLIFSVRAEGCFYDYSQYLSEYAQKSRGFVIDNKDAYFPSTTNTDIYAGDRFVAMYPLYYTTIDDMNTKIPFAEKFAWAKDHDQNLYNELAKMVVKTGLGYTFNANKYTPYFAAHFNLTKEIGDNVSISFQANNFFNNTMRVKSTWTNTKVSLYQNSMISKLYYGLSLRIKL